MFYAICGLSIFLFSCREEEADICTDSAQRIYLRATVENTILLSRAPFSLLEPNEDNPLEVAVWASTTSKKFEHVDGANGTNGTVALHTTARFTAGSEQLLDAAVYPKDNAGGTKTVYFVGMHPQGGWTDNATAGETASKTFNGSEDVMFAPQEEGVYGGNVDKEKWPTFKFKHLLTWLRVKVKADSEIVSEAWGKLKSLKVKSSNGNTVTIDLSKEYSSVYNPGALENCVTFSSGDGVTLDFYKTGTNNAFQNESYPLPYKDKFEEVAYVLCAPVIATEHEELDVVKTNEYTLLVETEHRTVEVPVDLKKGESTCFEGSTMNYQFILNLNFKMGNNIVVTVSVDDWELGGISNGVLSPNNTSDGNSDAS